MLDISTDHDAIEDSSDIESVRSTNHSRSEPPLVNPWRYVKITSRRPYRAEPFDHAAPLSPLRDQDVEIMAGWFDQADMNEVEQDIDYHLSLIYPEPPWEEALDLNFLKDHL